MHLGKKRNWKSVTKTVISVVMSLAIMMGEVPVASLGSMVHAAESTPTQTEKTITGLGTGAISNPIEPGAEGDTEGWTGSYVYYGKYDGKPVKYRVLDTAATEFGGNTMLLDCDSALIDRPHNSKGVPDGYSWENSEIRDWLSDEFFGNVEEGLQGAFTKAERSAIASSTKAEKAEGKDGGGSSSLGYQPLSDEKIFLLDAAEVTRSTYGYQNSDMYDWNKKKSGQGGYGWWLRSTSSDRGQAGLVSTSLYYYDVTSMNPTVSPAFNLNLSSVIFASLISGTAGSPDAEYKLTILDGDMNVAFLDENGLKRDGNMVTVPYTITGDNAGNATQVSVLITDEAYALGTAKTSGYVYAKLSVDSFGTSGSGTFTLPDAYADKTWGTDYHVYLLAEDVNGEKETDYACISPELPAPAVSAAITKAPIANKCLADGTEKALLSDGGQASGGTLYYALGQNKDTEPTADASDTPEADRKWKTSIPSKTEAGTYYVWVKAVGDADHTDSAATCVTVRICFPITFKVVGGTWKDGSSDDKFVEVSRYDDEDLALTLNQTDIPAVSDQVNGSWDEDPAVYITDKAISGEKTFTYTYVVPKEAAAVEKAPAGKSLTYSATEQELVTAGKASGGSMVYALGNQTGATGSYTDKIPVAKNVNEYYVWYKAKGDADHEDSAVGYVVARIGQAELTITVKDQSYEYNGKLQGEGDTIYTDPDEIAEKITVVGLMGNDSITGINLDGQATEIGEYMGCLVARGALIGDGNTKSNYDIEYYAGKLTILGLWGEIKAQADLTGRAWANDDSFGFSISAADGTPMPSKTAVTVTKDSTDKAESFGEILFTKAGEYTYSITQTHKDESIDGVSYDSADKTVTIKVKKDNNGTLVADGTALVQTASFSNTYSKSGEGEIKARAVLAGRPWQVGDSFEFTVTPVGNAPSPLKTKVTVTQNSSEQTESFGKITFAEAGEYSYILSQTHAGETIGGVAYDSADKMVTIKVKDDGKGHLVADGTALVQTAEFTNEYGATGSVTISASVAANAALGDREFTFSLLDKDGIELQRKSGKQGETINFDAITYDLNDAGKTFTYKIWQEIPAGAEGKGNNKYEKDDVIYDGEVKEVTVTVSNDKGDGTLDVSCSGSATTFTNEVVTSSLEIHNSVTSSTVNDKNREFRFTITLDNSSINGRYGDLEFTNGVARRSLMHNEMATAANLPVGIGYTVTETEVSGFTVTKSNNIGTIASTPVKAEFKFIRDEGNLKVQLDEGSSEVTVTLSNDYINGTYGEMTFMNGTASFTITSGQAITASGLPAGMGYQVTATGDFDTALGTIAKGETTVVKLTKKAAAVVNTAPTAKTLTYDATTQTLATAGAASGGSLVYAIGDKNGATESYTDQIPAKKNAGTYYLWYKAVGDADHVDSAENHIEVTIQKRKVSVSIFDRTFTYNGETLYGYTPTTLGVMSVTNLANNETFIISYVPSSGTNVGTYENGSFDSTTYNVLDGEENVSGNYELETLIAGKLKITPKKVTITAKSQQFTYDGIAHSNAGYDITGLVGDDAITAIVNGSITFPSEGPVENKIDSYQFTTGSASNYNVTTVNGALTMVNASNAITITAASDEWTYDGTAHANNAVTVTSGALLTGDTLVATATGSVTNVVDTAVGNNPVAAGYKVMHGTEDVTASYVITPQAGTLTVTTALVEITAQSKNFTYNGTAQSHATFDVTGLVGEDAITAVVTGSIMFPGEGTVVNQLTSYQFTKGDARNYSVTTTNGTLTMSNASQAITITAASDAWTYDASAHTNNEVTLTSGTLFTGDTLVATATGSVTNVVDTTVGNNPVAAGYKVMHGTEDVTASYVITAQVGTLTVNPKPISVVAHPAMKEFEAKDPEFKYTVVGLLGSDGMTGALSREPGEKAGKYEIVLGALTAGSNYAINYTSSTLTILEEDYLNELRRLLTYAIALGGNQTVTWEKGTALPYDVMKTLQDHPQLTLIFKYYYGNMSYEVTIHGKDVVTDPKITWYGPMNLYGRYGLKIGFINPSGVTGRYVVVRGDN
ncbi:MAG: hypothetical protein II139_01775, partial [Lachnospiraceae bacterium]|nr:hypothetical protein [Lachnospiraceae bacterium]